MATQLEPSATLVSEQDLRTAAATLAGVAVRTPLLPFEVAGTPIWLKPEMLQRGGAFKFRGAYHFLSRLAPADRARGVIAPSSGNHAQAVALAARLFGVKATVVMPTTVTAAKRGGAERLGAAIELAGTNTKHRADRAQELVDQHGFVLVPPYDHPWIIAGQGTTGVEIVEDFPEVDQVLVPVGGGGLSSGVAAAVKLLLPRARVVGVEPEGAPKLSRARLAGEPVTLESTSSIADGLMAVRVGTLPFAHHQAYVDDVVTVSEGAIRDAVRSLLDRAKLVAEPSGAITVAALREGRVAPTARTVCILSGGNIEWGGLQELLGNA
ncbi:MAG: threonine/serine dehydratase [Gemmatimonadaceae bacterium]|nr:threonine/serine dehydratase [Gemmatimonadaceae bacterium]